MITAPSTTDALPPIIDTLAPPGTDAFLKWRDPAIWSLGAAPDNPFVQVVLPATPNRSTGLPQTNFITIDQTESDAVASLAITNNDLLLKGALSVDGAVALKTRGLIDLSGTLSFGSLQNGGTLQGGGTVSSAGSLNNAGQLVGNAMTLNLAALTNTGTLFGTSAAGLTINVTGPPGGFTNLSSGTLTGGAYRTTGLLDLNVGGVLTIDAATIILGDPAGLQAGSVLLQFLDPESGAYAPVQTTLRMIAASGALALYGQAYTTPLDVVVAGQLSLANGARYNGPGLSVASTGVISGAGTLNAPIMNDGVLTASSTADAAGLTVHGAISGAGVLQVGTAYRAPSGTSGSPAMLELDGAVGQSVQFLDTTGVLLLDQPQAFTGTIRSFASEDEIRLAGIDASDVATTSYADDGDGGTLTTQVGSTTLNLRFLGSGLDASSFALSAKPQSVPTSPPILAVRLAARGVAPAADPPASTASPPITAAPPSPALPLPASIPSTSAVPTPATPDPPTPSPDTISPAPTTPTPPNPGPLLGYVDATAGQTGTQPLAAAAADAPGYLQWQIIMPGNDDIALSTQAPNVFIHTGGGNDSIQVASGQNVLDGGLGSNFMTGGTGADTFFTDARVPGAVWNTLRNFHAGDAATLWGFDNAISSYRWESSLMGADGAQGATLRANIVGGNGRIGDSIDASITFAGLSVDQARGLQIATGAQAAGSYLFIYNPGV